MNSYTILKEARKEFPMGSVNGYIKVIGHSIREGFENENVVKIHFKILSNLSDGSEHRLSIDLFRKAFSLTC